MLFEDRSLAPYQGEEPYLFLSYSHRDADAAAEVIRYLKAAGFRIWYDEGVIPATQWDENIARAIENCDYLIALISEAYLASSNCLDELNYARDRNIPLLLIYLEDVALPSGLAMRLGRLLAIHRYRYDNPAAFYAKVVRSKGLGICGDRRFDEEEEEEDYSDPDAFWLDDEPDRISPEKPSGLRPIFLVLLALIVAFVAYLLVRGWAGERVHGIYGSTDNSITETLPAPDPTPFATPEASADIEVEVTPTPEPTPSESPEPTPSPSPTPTSAPAPTLTPTPTLAPTPTPIVTPEPVVTEPIILPDPTSVVIPPPTETPGENEELRVESEETGNATTAPTPTPTPTVTPGTEEPPENTTSENTTEAVL